MGFIISMYVSFLFRRHTRVKHRYNMDSGGHNVPAIVIMLFVLYEVTDCFCRKLLLCENVWYGFEA